MKTSTSHVEYFISPPSIPEFLFKTSKGAWYEIMSWSYREYKYRIEHNMVHGHPRELVVQDREYSPIRILAEMAGFRRLCAIMTSELWDSFSRREQDYLIACFDMREKLFRRSDRIS